MEGKTTFYVEIDTGDGKHFRVVEVEAQTPEEALELGAEQATGEWEYIYQICKRLPGVELPQPVYDYFNGFSIYGEAYHNHMNSIGEK